MSTFQDSDKESTGEQSLILCGFWGTTNYQLGAVCGPRRGLPTLQVYGNNTEP
jgi:hypothetical protein